MTTCRIELEAKTVVFPVMLMPPIISMSRTTPAALAPHIPEPEQWTTFCDRIDAALDYLNDFRQTSRRIFWLLLMPAMLSPIIAMIIAQSRGDWEFWNGSPPVCVVVLLLLASIAVAVSVALLHYEKNCEETTCQTLRSICEDVSSHYSNLVFTFPHCRRRRRRGAIIRRPLWSRAIEVKISDIQRFVASPYRQQRHQSAGTTSTADLLTELNRQRSGGLLSNKEYESRRQDILHRL